MTTQTVINFEQVNAANALANIQGLVDGWGTQAYFGLQWDNFYTLDSVRRPGSGYVTVKNSGDSVAYNGLENPASFFSTAGDFTLKQGYFSAAWNTGLTMTAIAYDDGVEVGRQTVTLNINQKTLVTFGSAFANIDKVTFIGAGGRDANARDRGEGDQIAFDDLVLTGERQVANFDGLAAARTTREVRDGYREVNWDGIFAVGQGFGTELGLNNAMRSKASAAYTATGQTGSISSAGRDFDLNSGWFAAAGPAGTAPLTVIARGYDDGVLVDEQVFTVGTARKQITFNGFDSIDQVRFETGGRSLSMDDILFHLDPPGVGYTSDLALA